MSSVPVPDVPSLPPSDEWVAYETYMRAAFECPPVAGERAVLWIEFPAHAMEDNRLHVHPASGRDIVVARGSGAFVCVHGGLVEAHRLVPGSRVMIGRGVLHTFTAGPVGLLVRSVHEPWVPFDDKRSLVYPRGPKAAYWALALRMIQ